MPILDVHFCALLSEHPVKFAARIKSGEVGEAAD